MKLCIYILVMLLPLYRSYTIVKTPGNRTTDINGMLLPIFTVEVDLEEILTNEQKVQAYRDWQDATIDYLDSIGNESTESYRDAMFCYSGPAIYPSATEDLPPIPTCDDFKKVYNNTMTEAKEFLAQLNNATSRAELISSGQYDALLEEQEEKLRKLQSYFPGMTNPLVDDMKEQVDAILKEPSTADIIDEAVKNILGTSATQTQIDQAKLLFYNLLSNNKTTFTQSDIDNANKILFGTAGGALNSTVLSSITSQMGNTTWVALARGSIYPGDAVIDEVVIACGNSTNSKNVASFLKDLVTARSSGKYNTTIVTTYLTKWFGNICLHRVPGLPLTIISISNGTNMSSQTSNKSGVKLIDRLMKQREKVSNNIAKVINSTGRVATNGIQSAISGFANIFKAFG